MNPYYTLFTVVCCLILFNRHQVVLADKCSEDDNFKGLCGAKDKLHPTEATEEMAFIEESSHIWLLFYIPQNAKDLDKFKLVNIEKASDWLIQNIEKCPIGASVLGLGISIGLLVDSYSNNDAVKGLQKEYEELLSTDPDIFKVKEHYLQHIRKRTNEIRNNIVNFKKWQRTRTIAKSVITACFGWIGYAATDAIVKAFAFVSSGVAGSSAALDGYNWYELHKLVNRLEESGYIV